MLHQGWRRGVVKRSFLLHPHFVRHGSHKHFIQQIRKNAFHEYCTKISAGNKYANLLEEKEGTSYCKRTVDYSVWCTLTEIQMWVCDPMPMQYIIGFAAFICKKGCDCCVHIPVFNYVQAVPYLKKNKELCHDDCLSKIVKQSRFPPLQVNQHKK